MLALAGLVLYWQWPAIPASPPVAPMAERSAVAAPAAVALPAPVAVQPLPAQAQPLVPGMADTEVDGELKTDRAGNLQLGLGVRDYFDYFLSAVDQVGLDRSVEALLADAGSRLQEPALGQLIGLLGDYLDYKRASLALMQQPLSAQQQSQPQAQLATLQQAFDSLAQLRRAHFSSAAVEALFGAEEAYARYTLDNLALLARDDLGDQAKAQAQERLRSQLPEALRASEERQQQALAQQAESDRLWREGASEEQVRQSLALAYDPPTVERVLTEQRNDRAWRQRYGAYRQELAGLQDSGLSSADRQQEQQRLRQRLFSAAELHRVDTYDAIAAKEQEGAGSQP
ncbi:lipase chaperone [Pseudomonas benzenivorans]|uniref:Lipase chaperone n=2 Tax=Pseudomonas benzenivorans TaxID=556533 RepID=A0ABY5HFT0_9PSED|nr:lipase chaperone [Pseudomonas benzenivorans]